MCNYFTRYRDPRNLQAAFRFPELPNEPPRYVVRPTDTELVVIDMEGKRHARPMRWGLVSWWAKDIKPGLFYRGEEDDEWILEVVDQEGGFPVWQETFLTDQEPLDQAMLTIKNEGIAAFLRDPSQKPS